jgi:hypothetical protein
MKLFQIIASAQGSRAFSNMGQAFGFTDELMAQTVRYFIPPIAKAIEKRAQTPEGLLSVLEFLGSRRFDRYLDDPRIFGHAQIFKEGDRVLDYLFVRDARIKKIIENRTKVLPIEAAALEKILPYIAVMVIGAIEIKTRRPLGVIWHRIAKGNSDDRALANPYLALAQHLRKQERDQKDHRRRRLFSFLGAGPAQQPAAKPREEPALEAPALFQSV